MRVKVFTCWSRGYLDDDWRCHARTRPGHMTIRDTFAYDTLLSTMLCFFWGCCFGDGGATIFVYDYLKLYGANAQNTFRRIQKSYYSRQFHTKRCYWAVFLERTESRTLESHESLVCHLLKKAKSETKLHILYAIYWTTLLPWDWRTKL